MPWVKSAHLPSLIEALAMQDLLGHLGYTADELFILMDGEQVGVELRAENRKIAFRIADSEFGLETMMTAWKALLSEWNTGGSMTKEDKDELYRSSRAFANRVTILAHLTANGFGRWTEKANPLELN